MIGGRLFDQTTLLKLFNYKCPFAAPCRRWKTSGRNKSYMVLQSLKFRHKNHLPCFLPSYFFYFSSSIPLTSQKWAINSHAHLSSSFSSSFSSIHHLVVNHKPGKPYCLSRSPSRKTPNTTCHYGVHLWTTTFILASYIYRWSHHSLDLLKCIQAKTTLNHLPPRLTWWNRFKYFTSPTTSSLVGVAINRVQIGESFHHPLSSTSFDPSIICKSPIQSIHPTIVGENEWNRL